jgi:HTH-type transcriptional regulator, competence development regulator
MLTSFGKAVRKLRIDRGWLLREMADGVGVASSFLSAVETGRKPVPDDLVDRISEWGRLSEEEEQSLYRAFAVSAKEFRLRARADMSLEDREAAALLARTFGSLPSEDIAEIRRILLRRKT